MKYIYSKSEDKFCQSQFIVSTEQHKQIALANGYVEVSDEDFEKLVNHELCWENEVLAPYIKTAEEIKKEHEIKKAHETAQQIAALKTELVKVMEDIEQEQLGIVRDDYVEKRARAAEIINELRVLEGKLPRDVVSDLSDVHE